MKKTRITIGHIPATLWGNSSDRLIIAVHGNMSHKEDTVIEMLASIATERNYQVLSFDLPEHGERKDEDTLCKVQTCVSELKSVMQYAKTISANISLFACSMGAYFSLLAYQDDTIEQAIFLSPVVDMQRIITNMMNWFNISEASLKEEKEIPTPAGQTLYWDYYSYVKAHPIVKWDVPTCILYGGKDTLSERDCVEVFVKKHGANLTVLEEAEHFFHTEKQLHDYAQWLQSVVPMEGNSI